MTTMTLAEFEQRCQSGGQLPVHPADVSAMHSRIDRLAALYCRDLDARAAAWKTPARRAGSTVSRGIEAGLPRGDM